MLIQSEEDFENVTDEEWDYIAEQLANSFAHTFKYTYNEDVAWIIYNIIKSYYVDVLVYEEGVNDLKAKVGKKISEDAIKCVNEFINKINEIEDNEEIEDYISGFDNSNQLKAHYEALTIGDFDYLVENTNMDSAE